MEAVLKQPVCLSPSCYSAPSPSSKEQKISSGSVVIGRRRAKFETLSSGFCDPGHLVYYNAKSGPSLASGKMKIIGGKQENMTKEKEIKKMKKKKQLKLLEGLSRDLSTFSQIGFGLDSSDGALLDPMKGKMISEAAELLLEQLQKIKENEKELKKKMKEEKRRFKAMQMQNSLANCEMSSSSSSSESSDSECDEVINMNKLKCDLAEQDFPQVIEVETSPNPTPVVSQAIAPPVLASHMIPDETTVVQLKAPCNLENDCCSGADVSCGSLGNLAEEYMASPTYSKKIEVCMGGKCKKSGAGALMEEFQKAVGIEGKVSGCKCMGRCRDGPNIKVTSEFVDGGVADDSVKTPSNSMYLGVGLEDVNMIVANVFGQNCKQLGFAVAS